MLEKLLLLHNLAQQGGGGERRNQPEDPSFSHATHKALTQALHQQKWLCRSMVTRVCGVH